MSDARNAKCPVSRNAKCEMSGFAKREMRNARYVLSDRWSSAKLQNSRSRSILGAKLAAVKKNRRQRDRPRPAGPGLAAKLTEVLILTVISSSSSSAAVRSSTSSMHQNTPSDELTTPVHMHMAGSTARPGRPFTPEPAGRTGLREARAAPADTPAELLGSLPAPASSSILTRTTHTAKHVGWQAAQPERQQVQGDARHAG